MWEFFNPRPKIQFLCKKEDDGAIARPVPATKTIPEWFKNLPNVDKTAFSAEQSGITVKQCVPFVEAMTEGWLLCVPADIRVELSDKGATAKTASNYPQILITSHPAYQTKGSPFTGKVVMKFESQWGIITPAGYSCLFTQPLNRPSDFAVFSGIVDTDRYHLPVNITFWFNRPDGVFTIEKGTPIAQIIPFKRCRLGMETRAMTDKEALATRIQSNSVFSQHGWYRKFIRDKR